MHLQILKLIVMIAVITSTSNVSQLSYAEIDSICTFRPLRGQITAAALNTWRQNNTIKKIYKVADTSTPAKCIYHLCKCNPRCIVIFTKSSTDSHHCEVFVFSVGALQWEPHISLERSQATVVTYVHTSVRLHTLTPPDYLWTLDNVKKAINIGQKNNIIQGGDEYAVDLNYRKSGPLEETGLKYPSFDRYRYHALFNNEADSHGNRPLISSNAHTLMMWVKKEGSERDGFLFAYKNDHRSYEAVTIFDHGKEISLLYRNPRREAYSTRASYMKQWVHIAITSGAHHHPVLMYLNGNSWPIENITKGNITILTTAYKDSISIGRWFMPMGWSLGFDGVIACVMYMKRVITGCEIKQYMNACP